MIIYRLMASFLSYSSSNLTWKRLILWAFTQLFQRFEKSKSLWEKLSKEVKDENSPKEERFSEEGVSLKDNQNYSIRGRGFNQRLQLKEKLVFWVIQQNEFCLFLIYIKIFKAIFLLHSNFSNSPENEFSNFYHPCLFDYPQFNSQISSSGDRKLSKITTPKLTRGFSTFTQKAVISINLVNILI